MLLCGYSFVCIKINNIKKQSIMRGKFITTNIRMAALSGRKKSRRFEIKETIASTENSKTIWRKDLMSAKRTYALPGKYEVL